MKIFVGESEFYMKKKKLLISALCLVGVCIKMVLFPKINDPVEAVAECDVVERPVYFFLSQKENHTVCPSEKEKDSERARICKIYRKGSDCRKLSI